MSNAAPAEGISSLIEVESPPVEAGPLGRISSLISSITGPAFETPEGLERTAAKSGVVLYKEDYDAARAFSSLARGANAYAERLIVGDTELFRHSALGSFLYAMARLERNQIHTFVVEGAGKVAASRLKYPKNGANSKEALSEFEREKLVSFSTLQSEFAFLVRTRLLSEMLQPRLATEETEDERVERQKIIAYHLVKLSADMAGERLPMFRRLLNIHSCREKLEQDSEYRYLRCEVVGALANYGVEHPVEFEEALGSIAHNFEKKGLLAGKVENESQPGPSHEVAAWGSNIVKAETAQFYGVLRGLRAEILSTMLIEKALEKLKQIPRFQKLLAGYPELSSLKYVRASPKADADNAIDGFLILDDSEGGPELVTAFDIKSVAEVDNAVYRNLLKWHAEQFSQNHHAKAATEAMAEQAWVITATPHVSMNGVDLEGNERRYGNSGHYLVVGGDYVPDAKQFSQRLIRLCAERGLPALGIRIPPHWVGKTTQSEGAEEFGTCTDPNRTGIKIKDLSGIVEDKYSQGKGHSQKTIEVLAYDLACLIDTYFENRREETDD